MREFHASETCDGGRAGGQRNSLGRGSAMPFHRLNGTAESRALPEPAATEFFPGNPESSPAACVILTIALWD
jgi:hypothetical protein